MCLKGIQTILYIGMINPDNRLQIFTLDLNFVSSNSMVILLHWTHLFTTYLSTEQEPTRPLDNPVHDYTIIR